MKPSPILTFLDTNTGIPVVIKDITQERAINIATLQDLMESMNRKIE